MEDRLRQLDAFLQQEYRLQEDIENIQAVIHAYKNRMTYPEAGVAVWFYHGKQVTEEVDFSSYDMYAHLNKWIKDHGAGGSLWAEKVNDLIPGVYVP
jgi:hypothetical protein